MLPEENLATLIDVFDDEQKAAQAAAKAIAAEARAAVTARARFVLAVSGGRTPWIMLRALADEELPWQSTHIVQVDERVAPAGHPDRNLTHLRESLLNHSPIRPDHIHAMPVEASDLDAAADEYASLLSEIAGSPPTLDLVHLGLGPDGHTASLVPEDPVLTIANKDVAHRRVSGAPAHDIHLSNHQSSAQNSVVGDGDRESWSTSPSAPRRHLYSSGKNFAAPSCNLR